MTPYIDKGVVTVPEKREVRSKEERKAEIQKKIQYHKDCIKSLEAKIKAIDSPKLQVRAKGMKRIITEAKLSDEETAKALGFANADEMKAKLIAAAEKKNK